MADRAWAGTTFGTGWMHRWLIAVLRWMDIRLLYAFASVFVVPVCLVLNASRVTAYRYFRHRHGFGRLKSAWKTYTNHCLFGQVVIDRFAMYAGKKFNIEVEGFEHFQRLSQAEDAFLQLSSHVGNYELAGYTLLSDDKQFNALVYFGEKSTVMENRDKLFVDNHIHMIPVTQDMSHVFEMNRVLQNGEILSMPADRFFGSEKSISLPFLGEEARFPLGPFSVATARGINVITVHVMKSSLKGYKVYVTPLDYDKQAPRREQERQLAGAFVNELERILKMYPAQWYNYYEFWQS